MGKKKKKSVPVAAPKQDGPMTIDMNRVNLNKTYFVPGFRTGGHMTEKDRPRKKDWKREYERGKNPGSLRNDFSDFFMLFAYYPKQLIYHRTNVILYKYHL